MNRRLEGKVAVISGAGSVGPGWGNGRAMAFRFAQEGARIFAVDRDLSRVDETLARVREIRGDIEAYACNVVDSQAVAQMMKACHDNGAASTFWSTTSADRRRAARSKCPRKYGTRRSTRISRAYFSAASMSFPISSSRKASSIVNVASTSGLRWTGAAQVAYAATKAGVIQLSRVVAVQYAPKRIRVNTVVPGQLHTPMVEGRLAKQRAGGDVEALLRQRQARIPLGFMGDGMDTANAALFLASDEARFITGAELVVDGGMTVRCD